MPKRRNAAAKRNPAASRSVKARTTRGTRRSPDRLRERSHLQGSQAGMARVYGQSDVASLGDPLSRTRRHGDVGYVPRKAQENMISPAGRGGRGNWDRSDIPQRQMAGHGSKAQRTKRRKASTESALRRADASMFNYDD